MGRLRARSVMALLLSAALVGVATGDVAGVTAGAEMAVAEPGAEQVTKATSPRQLVSAIASRLERTRSEVAKGVARASPASGGLNAQFESSSQESQQQPAASSHGEPIAVLVCMQGAALSLEFDTLLKSLLANLPRRSAVELFVVGDGAAIDAAREQVARAGETPSRYRTLQRQGEELMSGPLEGALFPVRFELHLIDVSARAPAWEAHLLANISSKIAYRSPMGDAVHSNQVGVWQKGGIGQWYRYFSYEVLPARVQWVIYLDTDAMFVSNPVHVWNQRDLANAHRVLFQWDAFTCSGVLLMHTGAFERAGLWSVFQEALMRRYPNLRETGLPYAKHLRDQMLMNIAQSEMPGIFGEQPKRGWAVSLADGGKNPHLPETVQRATILHFNGKDGNVYGNRTGYWANAPGWRLNQYYQDLPWHWLIHKASVDAAEVGGGVPLRVTHTVAPAR